MLWNQFKRFKLNKCLLKKSFTEKIGFVTRVLIAQYCDQILLISSLFRRKSTFTMARDEEDFSLAFFFCDKYLYILKSLRQRGIKLESSDLKFSYPPQCRDKSESHSWLSFSTNQLSH